MIARTHPLRSIFYGSLIFFVLLSSLFVSASAVSKGPDLIITNISGQSEAFPGYAYEGVITIENPGDQTSGITSVILFFKSPEHPDHNATITSVPLDPLRPGQSVSLPYIGTVPEDLDVGEYHLYGYIKATGLRDPDETGTIGRLPTLIPVILKPLPERSIFEQEIVDSIRDRTNENRVSKGLPPLVWDDNLAEIASGYAYEVSRTGKLSHTEKNGDGPAERAQAYGYPTTKEIKGGIRIGIAENLAYMGTGMVAGIGYVDPTNSTAIAKALMDGWMESPGHRKNILDPLADRFGVGIFWNGEYYYTASEFW